MELPVKICTDETAASKGEHHPHERLHPLLRQLLARRLQPLSALPKVGASLARGLVPTTDTS